MCGGQLGVKPIYSSGRCWCEVLSIHIPNLVFRGVLKATLITPCFILLTLQRHICRICPIQRFVLLFCTRLFLSLNDRCPKFGRSRTFFSSALSSFSDYRFDIRRLEFCRLLVLRSRHPVEVLMNIFGKSFQFWTTEKIRNIESVL